MISMLSHVLHKICNLSWLVLRSFSWSTPSELHILVTLIIQLCTGPYEVSAPTWVWRSGAFGSLAYLMLVQQGQVRYAASTCALVAWVGQMLMSPLPHRHITRQRSPGLPQYA